MSILRSVVLSALLAPLAALPVRAQFAEPAQSSATSVPQSRVIQADALNQMLKDGKQKPVLFQVGSHLMYVQAHIPGSQYAGAGSQAEGLAQLRSLASKVAKNRLIVLYCGCCPWNRCPNVGPAYAELARLGYTNVKVLYIGSNFGADWVGKGYAVAKGE